MKQRRMGRTGLKVSEICLGTMTFAGQSDEATSVRDSRSCVRAGGYVHRHGRRVSDSARPRDRRPHRGGDRALACGDAPARRHQIVLATKCRIRVGHGPNDQGLSRRHILTACEASLRRLKTDSIDLYQAHFPDPETPIDETLRAFDDLVRSGKVRYVGCSNYPAWQLALALSTQRAAWLGALRLRAAALQRPVPRDRKRAAAAVPRPGSRRDRLQPAGRRSSHRQASVGSGPEAGGRFTLGATGELYRDRYWHSVQFEAVETLKSYCERRGWNLATASVAWVLRPAGNHLGDRRGQPAPSSSRPRWMPPSSSSTTRPGRYSTAVWWSIPRRPLTR